MKANKRTTRTKSFPKISQEKVNRNKEKYFITFSQKIAESYVAHGYGKRIFVVEGSNMPLAVLKTTKGLNTEGFDEWFENGKN